LFDSHTAAGNLGLAAEINIPEPTKAFTSFLRPVVSAHAMLGALARRFPTREHSDAP